MVLQRFHFIGFLFLYVLTYGQSPFPRSIEIYDNKIDGNHKNSHLAQDDLNYIWHVSSKGIYRFDGYEYQNMDHHEFEDGKFLTSDIRAFTKIGINKFAGYSAIGILRIIDLNQNTITSYDLFPNELKSAGNKSIRDIYYEEGIIWVACAHGLREVDLTSGSIEIFNTEENKPFEANWTKDRNLMWSIITHPKDPNKLIIGGQFGLYYFDKTNKILEKVLESNHGIITLISHQENNKIYGWAWEKMLFEFDYTTKKLKYIAQKEDAKYTNTHVFNDSCYIIANERIGFIYFNPYTNEYIDAKNKEALFVNHHHGIFRNQLRDHYSNVWLSTDIKHFKFMSPKLDSSLQPILAVHQVVSEDLNQSFFYTNEVTKIPENNRSLNIKYGAINALNGEEIQYAYRLNKKKWIEMGKTRSLNLTNLKHGLYTLEISASHPNFKTVSKQALHFSIHIPFHKRAIFIPLLALLGLVIIGLITYLYVKQLKSKQALNDAQLQMVELELQALRSQMNPHFMFNSLNSIKYFILQSEAQVAAEYLSDFAHLIRMILQYSRRATISLEEELDMLQLYVQLEQLRFSDGFEFTTNVEKGIDLEFIKIPPMLLQPYIENAIWHGLHHKGEKGKLSLNFKKAGSFIHCIVDDNGIGRKRSRSLKSLNATKYKSMGMGITQNRVELLNQLDRLGISIEVIDKINAQEVSEGTRIILKIPADL